MSFLDAQNGKQTVLIIPHTKPSEGFFMKYWKEIFAAHSDVKHKICTIQMTQGVYEGFVLQGKAADLKALHGHMTQFMGIYFFIEIGSFVVFADVDEKLSEEIFSQNKQGLICFWDGVNFSLIRQFMGNKLGFGDIPSKLKQQFGFKGYRLVYTIE